MTQSTTVSSNGGGSSIFRRCSWTPLLLFTLLCLLNAYWDWFLWWLSKDDNVDNVGNKTTLSDFNSFPTKSALTPSAPPPVYNFSNVSIAWLMSFPNSGTSYTMTNIQKVTGMSIASNYGDEMQTGECCQHVPIFPNNDTRDDQNGPFIIAPQKPLPNTYILTKTHCTVDAWSYQTFEVGCRTIHYPQDSSQTTAVYEADSIQKAVHLVRHPLDNLVARKHLITQQRFKQERISPKAYELYSNTTIIHNSNDPSGIQGSVGFQTWCRLYDEQRWPRLPSLLQDYLTQNNYTKIPCVTDLIEYVKWHDWALQVTEQYNMQVHVLYYEDYLNDDQGESYRATVQALCDFLQVPMVNAFRPFNTTDKTYHDYYTPEQRAAVQVLVKDMATPQAWELLKRYRYD